MSGATPSERRAPAAGTVLCGKYRVERELGSGGMGVVVVARHLKLDSLVAIKLLPASTPSDPYLAARFLREARAMARLASEHVVRVLDLDETAGGEPVLVMELLEGLDLERELLAGRLEPARAVDLALQACAALAEAHARGIVHRDVKPANLFVVRRTDGREQLKLLDFGISKVSGDDLRLTKTAMGLGSPLFMSPEQLLAPSQVDRRTDVWSLGVTLYRLLSGKAPYDARDVSSLAAQIAAQAPTPLREAAPALEADLAGVVMRCLEKDVDRRWPSVVALAEALEPWRAPEGLGRLTAVKLADAFGASAASPAPATELDDAPDVVGGRTLSHDVPRVEAPPALVPAAAMKVVSPAQAALAPPRRVAPVVAVGTALLLGAIGLAWRAGGGSAEGPPVPLSTRALDAGPARSAAPEPTVGLAPAAVRAVGADASPAAVPQVSAARAPEVAAAPRAEPAPRKAVDAGGTKGSRPGDEARNPADLEIKE